MASVELFESLLNADASEPCDNNSVTTVSPSPSPDNSSSLSTSVEQNEEELENLESSKDKEEDPVPDESVLEENVPEEEAIPEEEPETVQPTITTTTTDMPLESDENSDNHCKICRYVVCFVFC